jgi:cytoskeletal protein CcmA (bactofilin family)
MASTVIGHGLTVDGEVEGAEEVVVLGTVKGKLSARERVAIESGASVEAEVEGKHVTVAGRLTGDVRASERVEIRSEARVSGNIRAPRILIAEGAAFRGNVEMGA